MTVTGIIEKTNMPLFKEVIKRAKDIGDIVFVFGSEQMVMGAYSRDQTAGVGIKIHKSFFKENSYVCDDTIPVVQVNGAILSRALSRFSEAVINFDGRLRLSEGTKGMVVPCLLPEDYVDPHKFIDLSYENVISLPNESIGEAVRDLGVDNISSSLEMNISLSDYTLKFSRYTDYIETDKTIVTECDGEAIVNINYENFTKIITSLDKRADSVRLDLETGKPIAVKYIFPEGIQMAFALAPRMEDEERPYASEESSLEDDEWEESEWDNDEE